MERVLPLCLEKNKTLKSVLMGATRKDVRWERRRRDDDEKQTTASEVGPRDEKQESALFSLSHLLTPGPSPPPRLNRAARRHRAHVSRIALATHAAPSEHHRSQSTGGQDRESNPFLNPPTTQRIVKHREGKTITWRRRLPSPTLPSLWRRGSGSPSTLASRVCSLTSPPPVGLDPPTCAGFVKSRWTARATTTWTRSRRGKGRMSLMSLIPFGNMKSNSFFFRAAPREEGKQQHQQSMRVARPHGSYPKSSSSPTPCTRHA